jgi:hypothetical protein
MEKSMQHWKGFALAILTALAAVAHAAPPEKTPAQQL